MKPRSRKRLSIVGIALTVITLTLAGCSGVESSDSHSDGTSTSAPTTSSDSTSSTSTAPPLYNGVAECVEGDGPLLLAGAAGQYMSSYSTQMALAVDDESVFYLNSANGTASCEPVAAIGRVPKKGGSTQVLAQFNHTQTSLLVEGPSLYWPDVEHGPDELGCGHTGSLRSMSKAGGEVSPIVDAHEPSWGSSGVASNGTHVFWAVRGEGLSYLYRVPVGGGAAESEALPDLAEDNVDQLAADEDSLYIVANEHLYVASPPTAPAQEMPAYTGIHRILLDGPDVVFAMYDSCPGGKPCKPRGTIGFFPKAGGPATVLKEIDEVWPTDLAVDEGHVYWLHRRLDGYAHASRVFRIGKDGAGEIELAQGYFLSHIAVDETCLFWTDKSDNTVWKTHK